VAVCPSRGIVVSTSRAMGARNGPRDAGERTQEGGDDEGEDGATVLRPWSVRPGAGAVSRSPHLVRPQTVLGCRT
jgi:hypothetical protein